MLNFFKSNNLSILFGNAVLIVLYRVFYFFHPIDISTLYHHTEPASKFFIRLLHIGPDTGMIWLLVGGGLLCFICSLLINKIINSYKVTTRKNYMGGLLFIIFSSLIPECIVISPTLVAALLLLLCIDKIFELARPEKLYGDIFDLGFLSGLAMLFYFPAVYFLLFVSIGFFMMRSVTFRERVMIFTGFLCVLMVVFTVYFWFDALPEMALDMINVQYRKGFLFSKIHGWQVITIVWIGLLAVASLATVPRLLFSTVIQTRKYITILIVGEALSLLAIPLAFNFEMSHLIFLLISLSILAAAYFVETKTTLFGEILFIVLILSVFALQYVPLFVTL
jgi:hypothetical protein